MTKGFRLAVIATLFCLSLVSLAQDQASSQLKLSAVNVDAGDTLTADLTLAAPATCDQGVLVQYNAPGNAAVILFRGQAAKGDTNVHLTVQVPRDRKSDVYHSTKGYLLPCPGFEAQREFDIPTANITVRAIPDPNVYATKADVTVSVTQKQFLDTKIAELDNLDQQITTRIEGHAADVNDLRQFLTGIVNDADRDLSITEKQYRELMKTGDKPLPKFFADFHKQYQSLRVQLKAPIPGSGSIEQHGGAKLIFAQPPLKQRTHRSEDLSGTYPSSARDLRGTIADNKSVYRIIKNTGRLTFPAVLRTRPPGAHIMYKSLTDDDYTDYSGITETQASFELATWFFKFRVENCEDEIRQINPYNEVYDDAHPVDVFAGFEHCKRK
jgi:hypothetical protein